jgi:hypothetical protein
MDLGEARAGMVAAHASAPVLVLSDSPRPFVILAAKDPGTGELSQRRVYLDRDINRDENCEGGVCRDHFDHLHGGSEVLVTGSGRFIVALDHEGGDTLFSWFVHEDGSLEQRLAPTGVGDDGANSLITSLRDSDTVIVRDGRNRLRSVSNPSYASAELIADDFEQLQLVAVGNRHVIGRELIDDTHERLVLVPVDRQDGDLREATALIVAPAFTQVELTADDGHVIATSGSGDDAETFVFEVGSGLLVDRFLGAAVTGAHELESMAGMRASSPDGSHLAYRTPSGALALRDLLGASSCLVRSSSAGDHSVAGFAADGMLYMQADAAAAESHVFAFDTRARRLIALDPGGRGHHLAGVPSRLLDRRKPWAIGVRNGSYSAVQPDAPPLGIGAQAPVFVPRDDDGLWMADVRRSDSSRSMSLRRLLPRPSASGRGFDFGDLDSNDAIVEIDDVEEGTLVGESLATLFPTERLCLATGSPGGWAYQCNANSRSEFFAVAPMPQTENPRDGQNDGEVEDPVDPTTDTNTGTGN